MQGPKESFRGAGVKIDVGARPAMQRLASAARLLRDHCNPAANAL